MEKIEEILECWKKIYSAQKELMEKEGIESLMRKDWYDGAIVAIQSVLFSIKRMKQNEENKER